MLLLSTHVPLIQYPIEFPVVLVPQRNGVVKKDFQTSSMHLEYIVSIRGVDVAKQIACITLLLD